MSANQARAAGGPSPSALAPKDEFHELARRARGGDRSVLPRLRALLDSHPEIWQRYGDLGLHALDAWIRLTSGGNDALRESLNRKVADLRIELAGSSPSPFERLLADRAVATWLQLSFADSAVAQARADTPLKLLQHLEKRQERAHRHFMQALGALATVGRLLPRTADPTDAEAATPTPERAVEAEVGPAVAYEQPVDPRSTTVATDAAPGDGAPRPALALFDPQRGDQDPSCGEAATSAATVGAEVPPAQV